MSWKLSELRWRQQIAMHEKNTAQQLKFSKIREKNAIDQINGETCQYHRRSNAAYHLSCCDPNTAGKITGKPSSSSATTTHQPPHCVASKAAKPGFLNHHSNPPSNKCIRHTHSNQSSFSPLFHKNLQDHCQSLSTVENSCSLDIDRQIPQQPLSFLSEIDHTSDSYLNLDSRLLRTEDHRHTLSTSSPLFQQLNLDTVDDTLERLIPVDINQFSALLPWSQASLIYSIIDLSKPQIPCFADSQAQVDASLDLQNTCGCHIAQLEIAILNLLQLPAAIQNSVAATARHTCDRAVHPRGYCGSRSLRIKSSVASINEILRKMKMSEARQDQDSSLWQTESPDNNPGKLEVTASQDQNVMMIQSAGPDQSLLCEIEDVEPDGSQQACKGEDESAAKIVKDCDTKTSKEGGNDNFSLHDVDTTTALTPLSGDSFVTDIQPASPRGPLPERCVYLHRQKATKDLPALRREALQHKAIVRSGPEASMNTDEQVLSADQISESCVLVNLPTFAQTPDSYLSPLSLTDTQVIHPEGFHQEALALSPLPSPALESSTVLPQLKMDYDSSSAASTDAFIPKPQSSKKAKGKGKDKDKGKGKEPAEVNPTPYTHAGHLHVFPEIEEDRSFFVHYPDNQSAKSGNGSYKSHTSYAGFAVDPDDALSISAFLRNTRHDNHDGAGDGDDAGKGKGKGKAVIRPSRATKGLPMSITQNDLESTTSETPLLPNPHVREPRLGQTIGVGRFSNVSLSNGDKISRPTGPVRRYVDVLPNRNSLNLTFDDPLQHGRASHDEIRVRIEMANDDWKRLKQECPQFPLREDHLTTMLAGRIYPTPQYARLQRTADGNWLEKAYCWHHRRWEFSHTLGLQPQRTQPESLEQQRYLGKLLVIMGCIFYPIGGFALLQSIADNRGAAVDLVGRLSGYQVTGFGQEESALAAACLKDVAALYVVVFVGVVGVCLWAILGE